MRLLDEARDGRTKLLLVQGSYTEDDMVEQIPAMVWNLSRGGYMEPDRAAPLVITVKTLAGKIFPLEAEPSLTVHSTVADVKEKIFDREGIHVDSQRLVYLPQLYQPPGRVPGDRRPGPGRVPGDRRPGDCDDSITLGTLIDVGSIGGTRADNKGIRFYHPPGTEPQLQSLHFAASWRNYFATRSQSQEDMVHAPVGMCFVVVPNA